MNTIVSEIFASGWRYAAARFRMYQLKGFRILATLAISALSSFSTLAMAGQWQAHQENGYDVSFDMTQTGMTLTGSASYTSMSGATGIGNVINGSINNNDLVFSVVWPDTATGRYTGHIDPDGMVRHGYTQDLGHPSSTSTWKSTTPVNLSGGKFTGTFPPTRRGGGPTFIYMVNADGRLLWARHDGAERGDGLATPGAWVGPRPVGRGWDGMKTVFGGGGNSIYFIDGDGLLKWHQHNGFNTGAGLEVPSAWSARKDVGRGWGGMKHVFAGGNGVIYTIADDGILRWYKHNGFLSGAGLDTPGAWQGPKDVGRGWAGLKHVFSGGNGIIYTIADDGILRWYKHNGFLTGAGLDTPGAWEGPKDVGRGWGDMKHVFPGGKDGIIYTIANDGILRWYKHNGFRTGAGLKSPGAWTGPKDVGRGWGDATHVFALMPSDPPPVR